jgi:hypothetical protein
MATDFPATFAALREILKKHATGMIVQADTPTEYTLVTRAIGPNGRPMWFGCVTSKKSAVTYHLMPLYYNPKLQAAIPPELLPRKQGKTCFNFQRPDDGLFQQLDELTGLAREHFERQGMLEAGPVTAERMEVAMRAAGNDPAAIAAERKAKGAAAAAKRKATLKRKAKGERT